MAAISKQFRFAGIQPDLADFARLANAAAKNLRSGFIASAPDFAANDAAVECTQVRHAMPLPVHCCKQNESGASSTRCPKSESHFPKSQSICSGRLIIACVLNACR